MINSILLNQFIPFYIALIIILFIIHWITLRPVRTAEERLPRCRGSYLGLSLMILSFAWFLYLKQSDSYTLLFVCLGYTFSWFGDLFNLQFDGIKKKIREPLFPGILSFMVAQTFYIIAFLRIISLKTLLACPWFLPILGALLIGPAVMFKFKVYSPERPGTIMWSAFIYGFFLGAMAAIAVTAAIILKGPWIGIAFGALMFLLSDAIMGDTTIRGKHPVTEFQIPWITYLAAQGFLLYLFLTV